MSEKECLYLLMLRIFKEADKKKKQGKNKNQISLKGGEKYFECECSFINLY